MYAFLQSLPAIFGIVGFFAYLWAGQTRIGGQIFRDIVERLRREPNLPIEEYGAQTPARILALVEHDAHLRETVNEGDRKLLSVLIILQHSLTALVLIVCAALVFLSVWLMSRPQPLTVTVTGIHSLEPKSGGLLVDLDPIAVDWSSTGVDEMVSVYLENVETGARTDKKRVTASVRNISFSSSELRPVATIRQYRGTNRIRAVVESGEKMSPSTPSDLKVGIKIDLSLYGTEATPDGKRTVHTLFATIDDATTNMPSDYCFSGDFVANGKSGPLVVPLRSCNNSDNDGIVNIPALDSVNWDRPINFVYNGPDDRTIVRTKVSGHPPQEISPK